MWNTLCLSRLNSDESKTIKRYTYEAIIYFTMPHCLRGILHESCDFCANKFSIPPKSYPVNVPFKCDAGVDRYWHVTSVTCTGRANGGYKFQIKGVAQKTSRSLPIDLFYLMPGNRIKTAGTYYFPRIEEGKTFSFEVVSAFSGYAPSKFNGFLISSEVLQRTLQQELEEQKKQTKILPKEDLVCQPLRRKIDENRHNPR